MENDKDYLEQMHVPPAFFASDLSKVPHPQNRVVLKYVENFMKYRRLGWGLWMWGDYGSGKSAAGALLLKHCAMKNSLTGLWVVAENIPSMVIEKTLFDDDLTMHERMLSVDLLVIDEVVLRNGDKFTDTIVESVFRRRLGNLLPTCFTSNIGPSTLAKSYPALHSAMTEAVYPVCFKGRFRLDKADLMKGEFG